MSKKLLHISTAKLTAACCGLLLVVFCMIGMSFRPVYDEDEKELVMSGPRRSHWTESGLCSDTEHKSIDKGKVSVYTKGGGSVSLSSSGGGVQSSISPSSGTSSATGTPVVIEWNCNETSSGTAANHSRNFTFTATPAEGYAFEGWSTTSDGELIKKGVLSFTETMTLEDWNSSTKYESSPKTLTYYAHFKEKVTATIVFGASSNGRYTYSCDGESGTVTSTTSPNPSITTQNEITLHAQADDGYSFFGWYTLSGGVENYFGYTADLINAFEENCTIYAKFLPTNIALFQCGIEQFYDLNAANTYAVSKGGATIIAVKDGIVPAGNYTIASNVKLYIPYNSTNTTLQTEPKVVTSTATLNAYRTLTLVDGTNISCNGEIGVGGQMMAAGGGSKSAYVTGSCGVINMAAGGHVELNSGATLYCWGFIKGQDMDQGNNTVGCGTITANEGSVVWENFAVGDWRGGSATDNINGKKSEYKLFPFQSYSVQNVEIPVTYRYQSKLSIYTALNATGGPYDADLDLIGTSNTLFLMKDAESLVRKWYDPTTDLTCYELSGTSQMNALDVNISGIVNVNSGDFYLPISNNMHVIMTNCTMTLSKPMTMQAGSVIEIKNDAVVNLEARLHLFDKDEWGLYVHNYYFRSFNNLTSHKNRGAENSNVGLEDAKLIVDGTLNVISGKGYIYSTAGGANVMGNGGGTVDFKGSLPTSDNIYHALVTGSSPYVTYESKPIKAANLHNEDGSYTKTIGSSTFHNVHGRWFVASAKDEKANHTYDFTYMASGNSGADVPTEAVYAADKTGLVGGMKWCNVEQDATCSAIYNATQPLNGVAASDIKYTYPSDAWLQLRATETANVFGGSDNNLYAQDGCTISSLGSVDENCLYTISGVKKALVNGSFVALAKNTNDEAWHNTADATDYYICFEGCNWHHATKEPEEKAYTVEGGIYIWYEDDWKLVERQAPFFFDYNAQNVKQYYEYVDDEWVLATPCVSVTDALETRYFYFLQEAINVAKSKTNPVVTILRNVSVTSEIAISASMTIDLNGKTISSTLASASGVFKINTSGKTLTIRDSGTGGKIDHTANYSGGYLYGINMTNGSLNIESGKIYAENTASNRAYAINTESSAAGITMSGGTVEAKSSNSPFGIYTNNACNLTMTGGTFIANGPTARAIYVKGTTTLTNATITASGSSSRAIFAKEGTMTINSGTFSVAETGDCVVYYEAGTITINGGRFKGTDRELKPKSSYGSNVTIRGGVYAHNTDLSANCAANYQVLPLISGADYDAGYRYKVTDHLAVTWDATTNGGTCGTTITELDYNQEIGTLPPATKEHYSFDGWFTNPSGGTQITASTKVTSNVTYYAQFTPNSHTLTWDANGGTLSGDYTSGIVAYGTAIVPPTITREEYIFNGWNTTPASTMPDNDVTYTAQWTHAKASVTSGGTTTLYSSIQDAFTAANGLAESIIKLLEDVSGISANGCELKYTKASGVCTLDLNNHTLAGSVKNASDPKMLYINASGCTFTITDNSDAKGGTFSMVRATGRSRYLGILVAKGTLIVAGGHIYGENGHAWSSGDASSANVAVDAIQLSAGTSLQVTGGTIEAKAQLGPRAVNALGSANVTITGGTLKTTSTVTSASAPVSESMALYSEGGTTAISGGTLMATTKTTTAYSLYASSATQTITISGGKFKVNGGSSMANINNATAAANITLTGGFYTHNTNLSKYEKAPYYVFDLTSGAEYDEGYRYKVAKAYTLEWTTDGEDLTGDYTNGLTPVGATITPPNTPTKACCYTFDGWTPAFTGTMPDHEETYAATWRPNIHTLTWNANGGTLSGDYTMGEVAYGTAITAPSITRENHIFNGWHNGASIVEPVSTMTDDDLTYTAQWTPIVATVTADDVTTPYTNLPDAITAANDKTNAVVTMLHNTTVAIQISITKAMIIDLNGYTITSTVAAATTGAFLINASGKTITIRDSGIGGKISQEVSCSGGYLYGIHLYAGTLTIESGTIYTKNTANKRVNGIYASNNATAINILAGGKIETECVGQAFGIYADNSCALTMNGGVITTNGASSVRGVYIKGTTNLTNATIATTGTGTYTIFAVSGNITINSGIYSTSGASDNSCIYHRNGSITINGGYFSTTNKLYTRESGKTGTITLKGGYYNNNTELAAKCATNYHVLPNADVSYPYKVAEAYNLTWDANGGELSGSYTSGYTAVGDPIVAPTASRTDYDFAGWDEEPAATMPASDKTYTAQWAPSETGFYADVIDWTASTLTINTNGWTASGWPYTINDVTYAKEARAADRTLTIPYSGAAGSELQIKVQDKDDNTVSLHYYQIPFINTSSGTNASSIVYVNSGTLTISSNTTLAALYVRPEASVEVESGKLLTVGKLVMRTLPWQAAAINGNFEATETWYTRIAPNKRTISGPGGEITYESASYYQFALPRTCTAQLKDIQVSNAANTPYGNTWLLKYYDEEHRAENGAGADNWVALENTETIQGGVGYELFSNSNYYREFYFPLGAVSTEDIGTTTAVRYDLGAPGEKHAGWNIVASPLMSDYDNSDADPETGMKVSILQTDGSYDQGVPEYVYPAIPFSYQASEGQTVISFEGSSIVAAAPRRSMEEESVRKQWLHLDIKNDAGVGDQTSVLTHPTRYEETYKTGIDVAKQSFEASRALIYSTHTYGEMAFAGVSDALLKRGVALTVYSPSAQNLTISMRDNNWLERMRYVWLIDHETGAYTDLLWEPYTFEAVPGTTANRFTIQGVFRTPQVTTDVENGVNGENGARKVIINDKMYIILNGRMYDATGKIVK